MIQTIKTSCDDIGVVIQDSMKRELCNKLVESGKVREGDVIRHSYTSSRLNGENKDIKENNLSPTLDTRCDCLGVVVNQSNLRIRKLTPCECYKLMGFTPIDYERCAKIQSNATIYHQAGDSIVVTVLIAIFGKLLGIDYEKVIRKYVKGEILNASEYNI